MTASRVAFVPGHGVLVRRNTAVFFDVTGNNPGLVSAFAGARDDLAAVRGVKQSVIQANFVAAPFVMLRWDYHLDMLVFGDCDLHSSAPSAPRLNGAKSMTWVEHHLDPQDFSRYGAINIRCGSEAAEVTDLRQGISECGGMHVTLTPEKARAFQPPVATAPIAEPAIPSPAAVPDPSAAWAAALAPSASRPTPVNHDTGDSFCVKGHRNPPNSSACFTCGGMIGNSTSTNGWDSQQAEVGDIVFPEGTVIRVDRPIRLGSQPTDPGDGTLPVTIHHDGLSPNHAQVTVDGWAVLLTDLGSDAGTFVMAPGSSRPVRLKANAPHVLEAGTTVQLGNAFASFTYQGPVDV